MYARVVTVHIKPENSDEATAIFRDSVIPAAKQQKGYVGMTLLSDAKTGKALAVGIWESEADVQASSSSGYLQQQFAKFGSLFAAPPTHEAFEVRVQA